VKTSQDSTASEEKSSRSYWGFVLWSFVIVVFYALSYGPAVRAASKGLVRTGFFVVYVPLETTLDVAHLWRPFGRYLHLWCPDVYDEDGKLIRGHFE